MEKLFFQIMGSIIALVGIISVLCPSFISERIISANNYLAVEQRIKFSFLIGVGLLLFFRHQFSPWYVSLVALIFFLSFGFALARLIGIIMESADSRQLFWLGAESLSALAFGTIYFLVDNKTT